MNVFYLEMFAERWLEGMGIRLVSSFVLQREQWIPRPLDDVFAFFSDAKNLGAITPTWLGFQILTPEPIEMRSGAKIAYVLRWHGLPVRWLTEITRWEPPAGFDDVQLKGPYSLWHHSHSFEAVKDGTLMRDTVRYALPLGFLGRIAHDWVVRAELKAIFDYRAEKVSELLGASVHR